MSDASEKVTSIDAKRRLSDAIRDVKNAAADREDVVVEMREAQRMRLELLAAELAPLFAEVPADIEIFDFALSSGLQPRLWIDAVSHVSLGRDRRTYRFLRDTRLGRTVLAESTDIKPVADQVTRYVAERIVERQRMMEGDVASSSVMELASAARPETPADDAPKGRSATVKAILSGLGIVIAGGVVGVLAAAVIFWRAIYAYILTL